MPAYRDDQRGTWYCKYTVKIDGKTRQIKKRGFRTKREALLWEAEQKTSGLKRTGKSFEDLFLEYLAALDSAPDAAQRKRAFLVGHFPLFCEPFEKITREALVQWRNGLKSEGLATRTMNHGIGYVKGVFAYAERVYGLPNAAAVLTPYKLTREEKQERPVWTPDQFDRFLEEVPDAWRPIFVFLFWTGCRRGEALAVCRDDVQGHRVHIWRTIKHYKNGFLPLKVDSCERWISLDSRTMEVIAPLLERADPFVFGGRQSLSISSLQRVFTAAVKASGVPAIRIHDLRHSHATLLINSGVNIVAVSKRLGHASINQTLRTYTHLLQRADDEMLDILEKLH